MLDWLKGGQADKLDGKITDDTACAVNVFTKEGTKIDLPVLGVCTAVGSCGALEGATSEVAAAKGRFDEFGVAGRDDTKHGVPGADERSGRIALEIEAIKVSTDKAGDDEELERTFA